MIRYYLLDNDWNLKTFIYSVSVWKLHCFVSFGHSLKWKLNHHWLNSEFPTEKLNGFLIHYRFVLTQPNVIDLSKMWPDMKYWGLSLDIYIFQWFINWLRKVDLIGPLSDFFFNFDDGKIHFALLWSKWKSVFIS